MTPSSSSSAAGNTTAVATNHYPDAGDSPSWVDTRTGPTNTWTRNVRDITGDLAALQPDTGTPELQLTNPHGDIVATAPDDTTAIAPTATFEQTEYGLARPTNPTGHNPGEYRWLGGKQRSADALGGIVLMGVRLYSPAIERFLQTDPIAGGNANDYDYCTADPINCTDLDGRFGWKNHFKKHWTDYAGAAQSFVPVAGELAMAYRATTAWIKIYRMARSARFAETMLNSSRVGALSQRFGNISVAGGRFGQAAGRWNHAGRSVKIGWSYNSAPFINRATFRVGFRFFNKSRHFDLSTEASPRTAEVDG